MRTYNRNADPNDVTGVPNRIRKDPFDTGGPYRIRSDPMNTGCPFPTQQRAIYFIVRRRRDADHHQLSSTRLFGCDVKQVLIGVCHRRTIGSGLFYGIWGQRRPAHNTTG